MGNIGLPRLNWRTCGVLLLIFALFLNWLLDKGIPKSDIVLAFHAPANRDLIPDFATK
jgi:hypothetical protein